MSKEELLEALVKLHRPGRREPEEAHMLADAMLLAYINDREITNAFVAIKKWYS